MLIDHFPVMKEEVLSYSKLDKEKKSLMIDCTTGEGGHSEAFLSSFPLLTIYGIDRDEGIQKKAIERLSCFDNRFIPRLGWFDDELKKIDSDSVDFILFDLGISTYHYKESGRGFSFLKDEELDMRLDTHSPFSAKDIVNTYREEELSNVIYNYGEERYSRRISKAICEYRKNKKIEKSKELENIIYHAVPEGYRKGRINPATRTFQALRIEVNNDLDRLKTSLEESLRVLRKGARCLVLTFQSLEDRIVKHFFLDNKDRCEIITKKPIIPSDEEIKINSPSRSAKLRVMEKKNES